VFHAKKGEIYDLPNGEGTFSILRINGNMMGVMGPAALISIRPTTGEEVQFWIFQNRDTLSKRFPGFMKHDPRLDASAFNPYTFYLEDVENRYYTGLQANRDPGVPLVWVGCFLLVVGLIITFFTSHKRIWVRIEGKDEDVRIDVAGTSNKNPVGLQRYLEQIVDQIGQKIS
jgi:cytochrome c biogenesis protein